VTPVSLSIEGSGVAVVAPRKKIWCCW
jgi:hypothetical protein